MPKVSPEHLEARRQQILDAALTCFDRAGFHGSSMHDVFDEAGLSTGAVYRYFSSKGEIIEALAEERHAKEAALIGEAMQLDDPRAAMHRLAELYFGWLTDPAEQRRRRIGLQIWAEAVHNERLRTTVQAGADQRLLVAGILERARDRGQLRPDADPEALTRVYLALFQGFIIQQAWQPTIDVRPYLDQVHVIVEATFIEPSRIEPSRTEPSRTARKRQAKAPSRSTR